MNAKERARDIDDRVERGEDPVPLIIEHIQAAEREAMERCLAIAEEYPETPEVARDIRALIEQEEE